MKRIFYGDFASLMTLVRKAKKSAKPYKVHFTMEDCVLEGFEVDFDGLHSSADHPTFLLKSKTFSNNDIHKLTIHYER